jgi:hypothetical protein
MSNGPPTGHRANEILKHGQPAAAHVRQFTRIKQRAKWYDDVLVDLDVQPDDRPAFTAQAIVENLWHDSAEALRPGVRVTVRFDLKDGATVIDRTETDWLDPDVIVASEALKAMRQMQAQSELSPADAAEFVGLMADSEVGTGPVAIDADMAALMADSERGSGKAAASTVAGLGVGPGALDPELAELMALEGLDPPGSLGRGPR